MKTKKETRATCIWRNDSFRFCWSPWRRWPRRSGKLRRPRPSAQPSISTTRQRFERRLSDRTDAAKALTNKFAFRRAYFTYENKISDYLKFRFRYDADNTANLTSVDFAKQTTKKDDKLRPFVKHIYLEWSHDFLQSKVNIGMIETLSFKLAEDRWGYRSVAKTLVDGYKDITGVEVDATSRRPRPDLEGHPVPAAALRARRPQRLPLLPRRDRQVQEVQRLSPARSRGRLEHLRLRRLREADGRQRKAMTTKVDVLLRHGQEPERLLRMVLLRQRQHAQLQRNPIQTLRLVGFRDLQDQAGQAGRLRPLRPVPAQRYQGRATRWV